MGRLDVKIVAARNLPDNETFGEPDVYVKLEIENQTHKTSVEESVNPVWNEVFKFVIADPDASQLKMTLWNKELMSDDFLGQYNLSLSGLVRGRVRDRWCLLQNCKGNAEVRVRMIARDFGEVPSASDDDDPEPELPAQAYGARPKPLPPRLANQGVQHHVQVAHQPLPQTMPQMMPRQMQQSQMMQQQYGAGGMMPHQGGNMMNNNMNMMNQQQQQGGGGPRFRAGPDQAWKDGETVQFRGRPICATYTANNMPEQHDVTDAVCGLVDRGQMQVHGGIHTAIGDPAPGVPKTFKVWYQPSESYRDGETVSFKAMQPHEIVRATYGSSDNNSGDYTRQIKNLIMQGQREVHGGIHTAIGDPEPGVPKTFKVCYAAGAGIAPHKIQALRQSFQTWDADGSGFLDRSEALAAFFNLFGQVSPSMIDQKIREADTNGDGQLSFDEYARIAQNFM